MGECGLSYRDYAKINNNMKVGTESYIGLGVALGIVFGAVFGERLFGDVGIGIALGICFGVAIGVSTSAFRNSDK